MSVASSARLERAAYRRDVVDRAVSFYRRLRDQRDLFRPTEAFGHAVDAFCSPGVDATTVAAVVQAVSVEYRADDRVRVAENAARLKVLQLERADYALDEARRAESRAA